MRWLVAVTMLGACSLTIQGPPTPIPPSGPIQCQTSSGKIGTDIVAGTLLGLTMLVVGLAGGNISDTCSPDDTSCDSLTTGEKVGAVGLAALVAAPFYVSAFVGSRRLSSCRDIKAATGR